MTPQNWREAAGEMVMRGWGSFDDVLDLDGEQMAWWFETMNLADAQITRRQKRDRRNG